MQTELNPIRLDPTPKDSLSSEIATDQIKTPSQLQVLAIKDLFLTEVSTVGLRIQKKDFECEKDLLNSLFGEHKPFSQKTNKEKIHHFCLTCLFEAYRELTSVEEIEIIHSKIQRLIAQVIFLSIENSEQLVQMIKSENPFEEIAKATEVQLENLKNLLGSVSEKTVNYSFSTFIKERIVISSIQIAKVLILSNGRLNRGFIPYLIQELSETKKNELTPWAIQMQKVLKLLYDHPDLVKMIEEVKAPPQDNINSQNLVRAMLNLPPHSSITPVEAKIALVATLIYGPIGNSSKFCKLSWFYHTLMTRLIYDFSCLIHEGCLTRHEDGMVNQYPMVIRNYEEIENETWCLDPTGKLEKGPYLWELPGIQSACLQLDSQECKCFCEKALLILFDGQREGPHIQKQISKVDLLHLLTQVTFRKEEGKEEFNLALMAFNSRTEPSLLRILTATYAALVQRKRHDLIQQMFENSWNMTIGEILSENPLPYNFNLPEFASGPSEQIRKNVLKTMNEEIRGKMLISISMERTSGFYEFFEKEGKKPITSFDDFNALLKRTINASHRKLKSRSWKKKDSSLTLAKRNWQSMEGSYLWYLVSKLRTAVNKGSFVDKLLSHIDPAITRIPELKRRWGAFNKLHRVNQKEALEMSLGLPTPKGFQRRKKAGMRIVELVNLLRKTDQRHPFINPSNEKESSLLSWIRNPEEVDSLLSKQAMVCRQVQDDKITKQQVEIICTEAEKFVPEELQKYFQEKIKQSQNREATLFEFGQEILNLILQLNDVTSFEEVGQFTALLTHIVIQKVLTLEQIKILQDARIELPSLIDLEQKTRGMRFAYTINPVNGNLEIFQWKEGLVPLNQEEWNQTPWHLFSFDDKKSDQSFLNYIKTGGRVV